VALQQEDPPEETSRNDREQRLRRIGIIPYLLKSEGVLASAS
jgi:hypothetical protein